MHLCLFLLDHGLSTILLHNACRFDINVYFPGESRYISTDSCFFKMDIVVFFFPLPKRLFVNIYLSVCVCLSVGILDNMNVGVLVLGVSHNMWEDELLI